MTFNIWTFLFQVVNFVVLAYILHRLLYRPLRAAIDRRREETERAQAEANAAREAAQTLQGRLDHELADLEAQRQKTFQEAHAAAETERSRLVAQAQQECDRLKQEAHSAIAQQQEQALRSLSGEIRKTAANLAARLLQEAADDNLQSQLARRLVETLSTLSPTLRAQVQQEWAAADGVSLETAAELDPRAAGDLRRAVDAVLGTNVDVAIQTKPDLVAGVRLRIGGHVWDASLAGQLEDARLQHD